MHIDFFFRLRRRFNYKGLISRVFFNYFILPSFLGIATFQRTATKIWSQFKIFSGCLRKDESGLSREIQVMQYKLFFKNCHLTKIS